jgi:hypothetical protein
MGRQAAGRLWLAHRVAGRQRWRSGLEAVALAVSGLAPGMLSGVGPAAGGRDSGEAEEEDDGHGDPPEAKALLQVREEEGGQQH